MTTDVRPAVTLPPVGPALAVHNRRILAGRLGWPAGAVEACERFDATRPRWLTMWRDGARPGFYSRRTGHDDREPAAYGATLDELSEVVESWPWIDPDWSYRPLPRPPRVGGR